MIHAGVQGVQVWVATTPVDMRKSFDTLAEHVRVFLGQDPLGGNLFVFRNRSAERVKILWWDKTGLAIFYKRIERGTFQFPSPSSPSSPSSPLSSSNLQASKSLAISSADLMRLLEGSAPDPAAGR